MCSGGIAGFGERSLQLFERELKEALMPFVEKKHHIAKGSANTALDRLSSVGYRHYMQALKIPISLPVWVCSVRAGGQTNLLCQIRNMSL